jgi:hypothetical protein
MAPIETACGRSYVEIRPMSFTKADKDRLVQNFPEKISVSVSGFGGQEFPLRPYIKTILDQVQPPAVKIVVTVRGEPDDVDTIEISDIQFKVTGTTSGNFKVGDAEITYAFDADVLPGETRIEACECEHGGQGHRALRTFTCTWEVEIAIDPGIAGVYEVEEFEFTVASPCVCHDHDFELEPEADESGEDHDDDDDDHDEDDDDDDHDKDDDDDGDDDHGKKKKSGKKKAKGRGK